MKLSDKIYKAIKDNFPSDSDLESCLDINQGVHDIAVIIKRIIMATILVTVIVLSIISIALYYFFL
jgi:hypothetical protein